MNQPTVSRPLEACDDIDLVIPLVFWDTVAGGQAGQAGQFVQV